MAIKRLTDTLCVSDQIQPGDVKAIAREGFAAVINNRPDNEMPSQPAGEDIHQAADAAGLSYTAIPVAGAFPDPAIEAFASALEAVDGPVLAFCRSGMRSTCLWALSSARTIPIDQILKTAAEAGYDLSGLVPQLRARAGS